MLYFQIAGETHYICIYSKYIYKIIIYYINKYVYIYIYIYIYIQKGFLGGASSKENKKKKPSANARAIRDEGSIPGLGRPLGGEHGNPLQYSCLENPYE